MAECRHLLLPSSNVVYEIQKSIFVEKQREKIWSEPQISEKNKQKDTS